MRYILELTVLDLIVRFCLRSSTKIAVSEQFMNEMRFQIGGEKQLKTQNTSRKCKENKNKHVWKFGLFLENDTDSKRTRGVRDLAVHSGMRCFCFFRLKGFFIGIEFIEGHLLSLILQTL